jgi:GNAT superfamily N-acetyltransferase
VRKRGHNRGVIRDLSRRDLPQIRELLSRANDIPYDLEPVAEEKCFGEGYEGEPQTRAFGDFEGISVTCGKYLRILAVDRERRRRGVGSALLRDAESRGARIVAAEPGNYFTPGVLESMVPFFTKRGFHETARTHNLVVDALPSEIPKNLHHDRDRVLDFIERTFGPIWRFEALRGANIFSIEHEGQIAGFSTHEANNRGLGSFGPIGVAETFRGQGFGRRLLLASLADLKRLGYHRAVIPRTDATEYYRKTCGARIAHRFVVVRKDGA